MSSWIPARQVLKLLFSNHPTINPVRTDDRMSYKAGIIEAIQELKDRNGSSMIAIKKVMQSRIPKGKTWKNYTFLTTLKTGVASGEFIQIKNSYKLAPDFKKSLPKEKANITVKKTVSKKQDPKRKKATPKKPSVTKKAVVTKKVTTKKTTAPKKKAKAPKAKATKLMLKKPSSSRRKTSKSKSVTKK
mmetsp:Transcript_19692/g.33639  ORF Transcript_19692/g.33639 Transcript_19692/m.33639 type:complete len:188 (-) Transcript_19692:444-1007(-)